jgi:hypothetical protein
LSRRFFNSCSFEKVKARLTAGIRLNTDPSPSGDPVRPSRPSTFWETTLTPSFSLSAPAKAPYDFLDQVTSFRARIGDQLLLLAVIQLLRHGKRLVSGPTSTLTTDLLQRWEVLTPGRKSPKKRQRLAHWPRCSMRCRPRANYPQTFRENLRAAYTLTRAGTFGPQPDQTQSESGNGDSVGPLMFDSLTNSLRAFSLR